MPQILAHTDPDFDARLAALIARAHAPDPQVAATVDAILADVAARGLDAVLDHTRRLDRLDLTADTVAFSEAEIDAAIARVDPADAHALDTAARRITAYHQAQMPADTEWTDDTGTSLGWRWGPVDAAGIYVPGGRASYPSSVLMNAIPARVAGVPRVVMCAPTPDGVCNPLVLYAARAAGVATVYRIGGAQAIAALAYGAGPIAPVDKITGPGNAYVAAAKARVFGRVGIDMIAGPSEVVVIADSANNPDWLALDLMAQAEHDADAQSILITDDAGLAAAVGSAVDRLLPRLARQAIAAASWAAHGAVILARDLDHAADLANRIAPEHLQLCVADAEGLSRRIRHAGAIFLGATTPEALGDYATGPNHVLPTAGSARHASGLSVLDFLKRTTLARVSATGLADFGPSAQRLARSEGLEAHALSITARLP